MKWVGSGYLELFVYCKAEIEYLYKRRKGAKTMAEQHIAYCVKCKEKKEMKNPQQVIMKNGKPAMQGLCITCGTKLNLILPASAAKQ